MRNQREKQGHVARRPFRRPTGLADRAAALAAALAVLTCASARDAWAREPAPVYMVDSPAARESVARAIDLAAIGNLSEAAEVLQRTLDELGDSVLETEDPDLYIPARDVVHRTLLERPELLARYRQEHGPAAQRLLESGRIAEVESTHFLTAAGFEATLRRAQHGLENAQFNSALRLIAQLDRHPDRVGDGAASAAALLADITAYLAATEEADDAGTLRWGRELLARWRGGAEAEPAPIEVPRQMRGLTPFDSLPPLELKGLLSKPLATEYLGTEIEALDALLRQLRQQLPENAQVLHAAPTICGDTVYVNDSRTISAWDRFTLTWKWSVEVDSPFSPNVLYSNRLIEETSSVTVRGDLVVAVTGIPLAGQQHEERVLIAIDGRTGRTLWKRTVQDFRDLEMAQWVMKSPVVIDQGVVVVGVTKQQASQRLVGAGAFGVDASTGELLWKRPIASTGAVPWVGTTSQLTHGLMAAGGLLFTVDPLGVVAAVDCVTGRLAWARRLPVEALDGQRTINSLAWQANAPILHEEKLFVLSPDGRSIVMLEAATGREIGRVSSARLGSSMRDESFIAPRYLLKAGNELIGVARWADQAQTVIKAAPIDRLDDAESARVLAVIPPPGVRGRVVVMGERLLVPIVDGVQIVGLNSRATDPPDVIKLDEPGMVLPLESQLIVVDDARIHSYLLWDVAREILQERMRADASDPTPAVTFAEIAYRADKPDEIIPSVDHALRAIDRAPLSPLSERNRARLFRSLLSMIEPQPGAPAGARLTDTQRAEALDRLARCAALPVEQVAHLMAAGRFYEATDKPERAVESYQTILSSPVLAQQPYTVEQTTLPADAEATARIRRLVRLVGPQVYAAFEAEARREFEAAADGLEPEPLEAIARKYPVSRAAAAWARAAERYETRGQPHLAAFALEEGLAAAEDVLPPDDPLTGELAGRLLMQTIQSGRHRAALRMIETYAAQRPTFVLTAAGSPVQVAALAEELRKELAEIDRRPRVGPVLASAEPLEGWMIARPMLEPTQASPAPTHVIMLQDEMGRVSAFRSASGKLERAWPEALNEQLLRLDPSAAYLLRPDVSQPRAAPDNPDAVLVRRDLLTGNEVWASAPLRSLLPEDARIDGVPASQMTRINTPLRASVRLADVLVCMDDRTAVLVERSGRAAAFDLESGRTLWTSGKTLSRVHDAALDAGLLVLAGADEAPAPPQNGPGADDDPGDDRMDMSDLLHAAVVLESRTGRLLMRHEDRSPLRWVRLTPEGHALIGSDSGLLSLDVFRRVLRWRNEDEQFAESIGAWLLPAHALVRTISNELFLLNTTDGTSGDVPMETGGKLEREFVALTVTALGDRVALSSGLGVAIFDLEGRLLACDSQPANSNLLPAAFSQSHFFTLQQSAPPPEGQSLVSLYEMSVFEYPGCRQVSAVKVPLGARPSDIALLDDMVLVTAGTATVTFRAPAATPE